MVSATRLKVVNGVVVAHEFLKPPDSTAFQATVTAHDAETADYERWVYTTHPDSYAAAFHGPCLGSRIVRTPEGIAANDTLMTGYFSN